MTYTKQAELDRIKKATCQVLYAGKSGTGYLISGNRIVTCWHVVENIPPKHPATVQFLDRPQSTAFITTFVERVLDVAVLEMREPIAGLEPLQFGNVGDRLSVWLGFGFPELSKHQGLPIEGTLHDLTSTDADVAPSLLVKAAELAAGTGAPPHGYSGTPVVQHGLVVGHLKRIIEDPSLKGHAAYGVAYAAKSEDFVALIGETLQEARPLTPVPPRAVAADGYDVFLSASDDGLRVAKALTDALTGRDLRVYCPLFHSVPGDPLTTGIDAALSRSRSAVALVTPRWHQQLRTQADKVWQYQRTGAPVIPVLADGGSLPPPWDGLGALDLKGGGPAGPGFERLIHAINGQPAPFDIVEQHILQTSQERVAQPSLATARRLIGMGNPRRALAFLPENARDIETRRQRALALSKSGEMQAAIDALEAMRDEAPLDGESSGILGGCYRRLYERTKDPRDLTQALEAYHAGFHGTTNTYAGINTASILLELGRRDEAEAIARDVLAAASTASSPADDYWIPATVGEAQLILGFVDKAEEAYRKAVRRARDLPHHRATMRRGARRALAGIGRPRGDLDAIFRVPRPIAFVGHGFDLPNQPVRFPVKAAPDVARAIREILAEARTVFGVSSATVGGDTLFLDSVYAAESAARILLPCPVETFLEDFVVLTERKYEVRKLLNRARADVVVVDDPTDPSDFWGDFAPRLREHGEAIETAFDETPLLLALWDGNRSFLQTVIDQWEQKGWPVQVIRLQNGEVVR